MTTALNNTYLASGGTLALAFGTSPTRIYGSTDADTVTIAAGVTAVLDGSFNRGNDIIRFTGNAASYSIVRVNASTVRITDALGTSVTIPVGSAGTQIQFADATRTLSGSSAGIVLGDQSVTATATLLTPGAAPAPVESYTLSVSSPSVTEGDSGSKTMSYRLSLDKAPTSSVSVSYETLDTGSATANDDFVPTAGTVTFAAGQTVAFVSVTVLGDTLVEAPETVILRLSGNKLIAAVEAVGTIVDNDSSATYTLTGVNAVNEGAIATFALKTTGVPAGTTVGYKVTGLGSAVAASATGVFVVDSEGNATTSIPVASNNTINDSGSLTIELLNGKAPGITATVIDGTPTTYGPAVITTINTASGLQTINVAGTTAQTITLDTDQVTPNNGFVINSSSAAVTVTSGASNDKITLVGNANNTVNSGAGNDTVVISGSGNNIIRVGSGADTVTAGSGDDTIYVDAGNLGADDRFDGGAGTDTLVIAGNGNVITAHNVKNIENIVLAGTTVTIQDITALETIKSISGSSTSSAVTIELTNGDIVDLTGLALTTINTLTLKGTGTVTLKVDAADLTNTNAILRDGVTVNLATDVAGFKALAAADTAFNGTKTVTDTVDNLIQNKAALTGATLVVSGVLNLADAAKLADAGINAIKTVSMSVSDLVTASHFPDQVAALTSANTRLEVTGTASVAQAATINSSFASQIAAYQAAKTGNLGIAISDTPANVAAALTAIEGELDATGANVATVSSITLTSGAGVTEASAAKLALLAASKVSGNYSVTDSAANLNAAITSTTLPDSLAKASSVSLTSGSGRVVSTTANALELKLLGNKLAGGFDLSLAISSALTTDDLSAIGAATKATLTKSGGFTTTELNAMLAQNAAATVNAVSDTALALAANSAKLASVSTDIFVTTAATVAQANDINNALTMLFAKPGPHTKANSGGVYQNTFAISDEKASVLASGSSAVVRAADAVSVTDPLTLAEATSLRSLANQSSTDRLAVGGLSYNVTDSAANLAAGLSASDNSVTVATLAGATTVAANTAATIAQAKIMGASYSSAIQVDSYKISDTVGKIFSSGATLSTDIDGTGDAALAKATSLSVVGDVTIAQLTALKGVANAATTLIFDNKYAIKDIPANIIAATLSDVVAASAVTLSAPASVSNLAGLKTLNDALTAAGKGTVSYALSDAIATLAGMSASDLALANGATSVTATGSASTVTLNNLDNLANKLGSKAYTVEVTDSASNVSGMQAGVLTNDLVTKITLSDVSLSVTAAKTTISTVGTVAAAKLVYSLTDTYANLTASADASVVLGGVDLTATDAITAARAVTLRGLTGAAGKVIYDISDTYENLAAQAASIADGARSINVSNASLTVDQYTDLLARAITSTTDATSVSAETIKDTAANVSSASSAVLAHTSGVILTDKASLTLSLAQAKALINSGNNGYDVTAVPAVPATSLQVKIVDTTANLLKAVADGGAANTYVLGAGSYKVATSDTVTLTAANAATLLGISDIAATFNLADRSDNLVFGGVAVSSVAKAGSIVVTATSSDATTMAEANAIYGANKNVTFNTISDTVASLAASTGSGATLVYTNAAVLAKATQVSVTEADSLANIAKVKAAAPAATVKYDLTDTAANYAKATATELAGATTIAVTGNAAKASEAAVLAGYALQLTSSVSVSDTAANLVSNLAAVKSIATAEGAVSVSSGTVSAAQYSTLQNSLKTALTATTVTDTGAALSNFLAAGNMANAYAFTSKLVTAAQAKVLIANSVTSSNTLQVQDTAANLLALGNTAQAAYKVSDTIDLAVAKDIYAAFTTKASYNVATTAERFLAAYNYDTDGDTPGVQNDTAAVNALKTATSLTVDGVAITMGSKNAALSANDRITYSDKIVGTVAEINALPAAIKAAAGFVVVDSVANITNAANAGIIASSAGYVVKDSAVNLIAASALVLSTSQKALGIEVTGTATVAQINTIEANTDVDTTGGIRAIKYSLSDTAANLAAGNTITVDKATTITVTDVATAAQASEIIDGLAPSQVTTLAVTDSASALAAMGSALAKVTAITVDTDTTTAGLQGFATVSQAGTIFTNATKATVSLNIKDTATNLSTAVAGGNTALAKAGTISVESLSTAATAAEAKNLAKITIVGGYIVSDTATALTTPTTVALDDLRKATTVKVSSGTATVAEAITLTSLGNLETGTALNTGKYVLSIADSAVNIAKSLTLDMINSTTSTSTVAVNSYGSALTAAQATTLAALDAASTKLNTIAGSVIVSDTSSALLDPTNAAALAAVGAIRVTDTITVATLALIKTVGGNDGETYTYKLADTAQNLITAGTATIDNATSIRVTDAISVGDMTLLEARLNASVANGTTATYAKVSDTAANLVSGGVLNATVASKADVIGLLGTATVAQVKALMDDSNFDRNYAIADTASNLVNAINQDASLALLTGAASVGLATGQTATAVQALVINTNLANEASLAVADTAANLNNTDYASAIAAAASVSVDAGSGNDGLRSGITSAKITYVFDNLDDMGNGSGTTIDVINGKTGDVIDLSAITDWNISNGGNQGNLILGSSAATLVSSNSGGTAGGQYFVERGYLDATGTWVVSATGSDSRLLIGTDSTPGADEVIIILGVTSLIPNAASGDVNTFTFG